MGWLTTHGVRLEDGKCELGSCPDLSSRTGKHVPSVSPAVLGIRQVFGIKQAFHSHASFFLDSPDARISHKSMGT